MAAQSVDWSEAVKKKKKKKGSFKRLIDGGMIRKNKCCNEQIMIPFCFFSPFISKPFSFPIFL